MVKTELRTINNTTELIITTQHPKLQRLDPEYIQDIFSEILTTDSGTLEIKIHKSNLELMINHKKINFGSRRKQKVKDRN